MYELSKISERIKEIISDEETNAKKLSDGTGIGLTNIYKWKTGVSVPSLDKLVKLADYFNCSIDYLFGFDETENKVIYNKELPPFNERLPFVLNKYQKTAYRVCKETKIHEQAFGRWISGKFVPSLDNIIKIADNLGCTIDYLIGRE